MEKTMSQSVRTLIIPAAGAGTRLRPITYAMPKEMVRLVDKPIAYYLLAEAYEAGIRHVVFVIHKDNRLTREFFDSENATPLLKNFPELRLTFVETDVRGGDGQAILLAKNAVKGEEAFAVTMGDLVALPGTSLIGELVDAYRQENTPVISIEKVAPEKTGQYGIIDPSGNRGRLYGVRGIIEKPQPEEAPSNLAMTGKYVLTLEIFSYLEALQAKTEGELKLAYALNDFARERGLHAWECIAAHYDTGTKIDLFKAEVAFTLVHPELGEAAQKILTMENA